MSQVVLGHEFFLQATPVAPDSKLSQRLAKVLLSSARKTPWLVQHLRATSSCSVAKPPTAPIYPICGYYAHTTMSFNNPARTGADSGTENSPQAPTLAGLVSQSST